MGGAGSSGNGGAGGSIGTGGLGGFDTRVLDLRGFERFRIDQTPAITELGCPTPYRVDPAEIEKVGDDEYLLTWSSAFSSEEELLECLQQAADPDECHFAPPVPGAPRILNTAQLSELMALFSDVSVNFAPNPCEGISVDDCRILRLTWDDLETSDLFCENPGPWVDSRFANDVLEAVSQLVFPPPSAQCAVPAHCGFNTVEMTLVCDDGRCSHADHPRGLCFGDGECDEFELCYLDPRFAGPTEIGGVCVPERCDLGEVCPLEDGGVIALHECGQARSCAAGFTCLRGSDQEPSTCVP